MRIALCLSGQPRTLKYAAPSILNFFSDTHTYDYFCHAWDYNNYKKKSDGISWTPNELIDKDELTNDLAIFNPKSIQIHGKCDLPRTYNYWSSLFYSAWCANHLKKKYEIENDFRYDLVIKLRYDLVFNPGRRFKLNHPLENDLEIYCMHHERMPYEYMRPNFSDIIYYGSSRAMDGLSDVYKFLNSNRFRMDNYEGLGPGTWLTKYSQSINLRSTTVTTLEETIYRDDSIPAHYQDDYAIIADFHRAVYLNLK
jgi:hypothetical protein